MFRRLQYFVVCLAALTFVSPISAHAQSVQDFVVTSFKADYELDNADPQGRLTTAETIEVDFSGNNHGIIRAIPAKYVDLKTHPEILSVRRDGVNEPYTTYDDAGNLVVKIGDAGKTITGGHRYEITYAVENVITFYEDHDELYWDVNGSQWLQSFEGVEMSLNAGVPLKAPGVMCFTGDIGSTAQDCRISTETKRFTVVATEALNAGETLTFVAAFEKGYFTPPGWWELNWRYVVGVTLIISQFWILYLAYKKWQKRGKDYKNRGITVPYFGRPKNVSVIQASYVAVNKLLPKHMTAAIIDLAIRGYIKIAETEDRKPKHELMLVKAPDGGVSEDEIKLLEALFDGVNVRSSVKLEDKKHKLYKTTEELKKLVDKNTKKKGFYEVSPVGAARLFVKEYLLSVVVLIVGFVNTAFLGPLGVLIGVTIFALILMFGALMSKRSQEGNLLKEHMEGLKLYLERAEKDRLAAHDAVAAPLAPKSENPRRDVKFFEKLLPFAVAYGVEKTWAKAFSDIYQQPPDWYTGNWQTFSTLALASSLSKTSSATTTAFSAPSSSGSSGFSGGGGFAGGGGGGGGGGGW